MPSAHGCAADMQRTSVTTATPTMRVLGADVLAVLLVPYWRRGRAQREAMPPLGARAQGEQRGRRLLVRGGEPLRVERLELLEKREVGRDAFEAPRQEQRQDVEAARLALAVEQELARSLEALAAEPQVLFHVLEHCGDGRRVGVGHEEGAGGDVVFRRRAAGGVARGEPFVEDIDADRRDLVRRAARVGLGWIVGTANEAVENEALQLAVEVAGADLGARPLAVELDERVTVQVGAVTQQAQNEKTKHPQHPLLLLCAITGTFPRNQGTFAN